MNLAVLFESPDLLKHAREGFVSPAQRLQEERRRGAYQKKSKEYDASKRTEHAALTAYRKEVPVGGAATTRSHRRLGKDWQESARSMKGKASEREEARKRMQRSIDRARMAVGGGGNGGPGLAYRTLTAPGRAIGKYLGSKVKHTGPMAGKPKPSAAARAKSKAKATIKARAGGRHTMDVPMKKKSAIDKLAIDEDIKELLRQAKTTGYRAMTAPGRAAGRYIGSGGASRDLEKLKGTVPSRSEMAQMASQAYQKITTPGRAVGRYLGAQVKHTGPKAAPGTP